LRALRWIFLAVLAGALLRSAWSAPWHAELVDGNTTYLVELGNAPLWSPPPEPPFSAFADAMRIDALFRRQPFVAESVAVVLEWRRCLLLLALWLWPVCLFFGWLYWATRGARLDLVLHTALGTGNGLLLAAAATTGLWVFGGRWGPPFVVELAAVGGIGGALAGLVRWAWLQRAARRGELPSGRRSATIR
jgi:hypothetical protein